MDEAWKSARLDELWDAYLPLPPGAEPSQNEPRTLRAIEAIRLEQSKHAEAKSENNKLSMFLSTGRARTIWQLLTLEIAAWTADDGLILSNVFSDEDETRYALGMALGMYADSAPHLHRPAVDPIPVLLPRRALRALSDALAALDQGEVHNLVKPAASGRHGDAWSWDRMRTIAIEHVAYLRGQGLTKQIARSRVAAAMKVPPNSLRDWEGNQELTRGLKAAEEAGKLKVILEDNPRYAEGDGNSVDSAALARLKDFKTGLALAEFGRAYHEAYGRRHNPDPSAGK